MSEEGKLDTDRWYPVILLDDTDFKTGETGKVVGDLTVEYRRLGDAASWQTYSPAAGNWNELGDGEYALQMGAGEFTTAKGVGIYQVHVQCTGCLTYRFSVEVRTNLIEALALEATLTAIKGSGWVAADNLAEIAEDVAGLNGDAMYSSVMRGTDNALLAASAPSNWSSMVISGTGIVNSNVEEIDGDATKATRLGQAMTATIYGAAIAGTLSNTQMSTDLTEVTNNHYKGRVITWISGVLLGQSSPIIAYNGSTKVLTYTATTDAPSATDKFIIT